MLENYDSGPMDAPLEDSQTALDHANLQRLAQVSKWARWAGIAILGFWGVIFLLIAYIALRFGLPLSEIVSSIDSPQAWLLLLFYFGLFVVSIILASKLIQFANKAHQAAQVASKQQLEFALEELATYFKILGISFALLIAYSFFAFVIDKLS